MKSDQKSIARCLKTTFTTRTALGAILHASVVLLLLIFLSSAGWAQGLPVKVCSITLSASGSGYSNGTGVTTTGGYGSNLRVNITTSNGGVQAAAINAPGAGYKTGDIVAISGGDGNATVTVTTTAYLCLDDIVVVDGSGFNSSLSAKVGGLYVVDPVSGNQTAISTGGLLGQAASVTLEPGTGKILASTRTYGVIRVDPKDGSQEVILKGGTGWGSPFPTFPDSANNNAMESFIYPAGITIDPVDSSILVTDTGINLFSRKLNGDPNCTNPNDVRTCESLPSKIIRIKRGQAAGVYTATAVVAKGGLLSNPFDIAVDGGSNIYVTDMTAKLVANDPGMGGIVYLNATSGYAQNVFFSSYSTNTTGTTGCPMGITINPVGTVFATVFAYNGYGCAPQAVFSLTPDPSGQHPPTLSTVVNGYPFQYPFGMDVDRSGRILIADEGSGYGCGGTIFRLDLTKPIVTQYDGNLNDFNPFALSPIVGAGCSPPNQKFLVTPSDVAAVKVFVPANISNPNTPPSNVSVSMSPATINENASASLSGSFADPDTGDTHTVTITWGDGSPNTVLNLGAGVLTIPPTAHQYLDNRPSNAAYTVNVSVIDGGTTPGLGSATVTVMNAPPVITGVSGPAGPLALGTVASIGVNFTDAGTLDTHTCTFSWGDTPLTTTTVSATETNGSGSCAGTRTYPAAGVYTVGITVTDKDGGTAASTFANVAIFSVAINGAPSTSPEGTPIALTSTVTVSGGSYAWTVTKNASSFTSGTASNLTFTPDDNGTYVVTLIVTISGQTASDSKTISVTNVAPTAAILGVPVSAFEGSAITLTSMVSDPSTVDTAAAFLYSWTVLKNGSPFASGSAPSLTFTPDHSGSYAVTLNVTDKDGGTGTALTTINVANVPPVITSVTGPVAPLILGSSARITANFTDAGTANTHTCAVKWGDTTTSAGTVTETQGSGSCTQTHIYADDGVYTVTVTLTDDAGAAATSNFQFVVIYDPTEATLTGAGSFVSPAGADAYDPSLTDTANFGFSVKYANGTIDPSSYKQFSFDLGNLWFQSNTVDWFVSSGANAQFKGTGSMNGDGRLWTYLTTVTDGHQPGGGGVDKYRVKIIDDAGLVVYDNVRGAPDDINLANPQPIASGQITLFFNTPPTVSSLSLAPTTINEGRTVTLTGAFTDPDVGQTHTVTINWGDGTAVTTISVDAATSANFSASHTYKDNPTGTTAFTVGVSVADSMGAVGTGSTSVTVNNVPPVITTVTGPTTTVSTGANATVKVNFTDVGVLDTHTCAYAWGDGQTSSGSVTETNGSGSCTASHIYTAGGAQTVTITVTDKDGGSVSSTFSLLVNSPPSVSAVSLSATTINEGGQSTLTGSFTDADSADTHTVTINWGDGTANSNINLAAGTLNFSSIHTFKDNPAGTPSGGSFTIGVTVADNHSGKGTGSTSITVNNVAPVIGAITKPSPAVLLGNAANLKVNFTDAGTLDTHTCTFTFGDTQTGSGSVTETNGNGSCSASHTYTAAGTYTVMVTVTDKDGASVSSSFQVVVDTPPAISTLSLGTTATINEGSQANLTGGFTDPDTSDTHKITINWGDGTGNTTINLAAGTFNFSANHTYADNPAGIPTGGTFTINVTVSDNLVGSATGSTTITVNNVAPVLNVPANAVYGNSPGLTQNAWSPFTDLGKLDTHTCTYGWGDGHSDTFPAASDSNGSGVCSFPHTYASSGTYTLTVTVVDKDGGSTGPKTFPLVVPGS